MQKKIATKGSKKQQQIVNSGKELFFQYGVKRIRVEEICRKAKVSKMTFYKYFENKFALAEHIVQEILNDGCKSSMRWKRCRFLFLKSSK